MALVPNDPQPALDDIDRAILEAAQRGRADHQPAPRRARRRRAVDAPGAAALAARARRVRGFHAEVDLAALGRPLQALIAVRLAVHAREQIDAFTRAVRGLPGVLMVFHLTGATDYLVWVAAADAQDLREFVVDHLATHPAVAHAETSLIYEHRAARGSGAGWTRPSAGPRQPRAGASARRARRRSYFWSAAPNTASSGTIRREQRQRGPQLQVVQAAEDLRARCRCVLGPHHDPLAHSRSPLSRAAGASRKRRTQRRPKGRNARRSDSFPARAAAGTRTTSNASACGPVAELRDDVRVTPCLASTKRARFKQMPRLPPTRNSDPGRNRRSRAGRLLLVISPAPSACRRS